MGLHLFLDAGKDMKEVAVTDSGSDGWQHINGGAAPDGLRKLSNKETAVEMKTASVIGDFVGTTSAAMTGSAGGVG
jgi:hypothetical protein